MIGKGWLVTHIHASSNFEVQSRNRRWSCVHVSKGDLNLRKKDQLSILMIFNSKPMGKSSTFLLLSVCLEVSSELIIIFFLADFVRFKQKIGQLKE